MKTGTDTLVQPFPQTFYICLLCLQAILKRCGFADALLYREHNPSMPLTNKIIDMGILFNLFSNFGVGVHLKSLIIELFKEGILDIDKYEKDIYFCEILELCEEASNILKCYDVRKEIIWCYAYSLRTFPLEDEIYHERIKRITNLSNKSIENTNLSNKSIETNNLSIETKNDQKCNCNFCKEIRSYEELTDKNVEVHIIETLQKINNCLS